MDEYKALSATLKAFYDFGDWERREIIQPRTLKWKSLSKDEQELLAWFPEHLTSLSQCIANNELFMRELASKVAADWGNSEDSSKWGSSVGSDLDKVRSTMLQFTREWSELGSKEREICYGRITQELESMYPKVDERQRVKVLVPGCGLGRLVVELVKRGFQTQGNEFSYHMLLASNFILNHTFVANNYQIFPFIHRFSHNKKRNLQLAPVFIPDYNPGDISFLQRDFPDIPVADLMSMTAGSFVDLYGPPNLVQSDIYTADDEASQFRALNKGTWDVVATTFFLDTASNVIEYLKSIHHCLKPHGHWINFGPLLWHYENDENVRTRVCTENGMQVENVEPMKGLELTRDDLVQLIKDIGFIFLKHESEISSPYCGDERSLGGWEYKCEYWLCEKV
ncbi:BA75_03089T0 [Komagataella pastoris]|uniref:carnosine N-methyltransferase n=1 Tax=Komagataella pastoris TaxID=4922 RepID=A0A1B2JEE6_PICPA|nr:BA75_03089T0 [Komagataella pastoris]